MAWYDAGTVNVTLNSATVTGVGTQWVAGARQGEAFVGPDGRLYEVLNIASNTSLTLTRPYRGATQAAQPYALAPFQGYVKELADRAAQLLSAYGTATDEEALARSSATKALSPRGLGLNVLQDPYAATPGLLLQNGSHGVGTMSKTWRVGSTLGGTSWLALCDVFGAASDRGTIILSGGYGFNSGTNQGSCTTVISLTMGNSDSDDNLLVRALQLFDNAGIQQVRTAWLPEASRWRVWVRATPYTTLVASFSGNLMCVPIGDMPYFDIPGSYEKPVEPAWSAYNFDPASKADKASLKTGAFADIIGDVGAGAVMNSGSNAGGSWWRFQSGLQICATSDLAVPWLDLQYSPGIWTTPSIRWYFPLAFTGIPACSGHIVGGVGGGFVGLGGDATAPSYTSFSVKNSSSSASVNVMSAIAIGRWK